MLILLWMVILNIGNYNMAMKELMEFIMDFPRNQIEQLNLQYIIN